MANTIIKIPAISIVMIIGPSGSGKSSFARKHFKPTEIVSSDYCRALVSDDENDQTATKSAFEILHLITSKRLEAGKLVVVDATNVEPEARHTLASIAKKYHAELVSIVLNLPKEICYERNLNRPHRQVNQNVIWHQSALLQHSLNSLHEEGIEHIYLLNSDEEINSASIEISPATKN